MAKDRNPKSQIQVAASIKACLDQLADEASEANLSELCQLIKVAALAAEDAIGHSALSRRRVRRSGASSVGASA